MKFLAYFFARAVDDSSKVAHCLMDAEERGG